ncbi:MAG TPA: DUF6101 family protein [Beijerinckiaceae bacterium]|jgi:hypothetical protein|nr:DUF6101 family protein [Beijerinckiaceae bacterium]
MSDYSLGGGARAAANKEAKAFTFVTADRRADGALRHVSIDARSVRIERRIGGIAMHIGLMASAYRGVALSLAPTNAGGACYRVRLVHRDRDLDVELATALDEVDGSVLWRDWAAYFALPKLVERAPDRFETMATPLGALTIGPRPAVRRRGAALAKRRPSIRLRRRMPPPRAAQVFGGEREIVSYE